MSAFMQDKAHIDALVALAVRGPSGVEVNPGTAWYGPYFDGKRADHAEADAIGTMLVRENLASIHYRYPDTIDAREGTPGPNRRYWETDYVWPFGTPRLTAIQGLAALDGYEYQACEHPGWLTSDAHSFCDGLRRLLIGNLPGYRDANTWAIQGLAAV